MGVGGWVGVGEWVGVCVVWCELREARLAESINTIYANSHDVLEMRWDCWLNYFETNRVGKSTKLNVNDEKRQYVLIRLDVILTKILFTDFSPHKEILSNKIKSFR